MAICFWQWSDYIDMWVCEPTIWLGKFIRRRFYMSGNFTLLWQFKHIWTRLLRLFACLTVALRPGCERFVKMLKNYTSRWMRNAWSWVTCTCIKQQWFCTEKKKKSTKCSFICKGVSTFTLSNVSSLRCLSAMVPKLRFTECIVDR